MKKVRSRRGFTLVEVMITLGIISLLATFAIPGFVQSRQSAREGACVSNLRLIQNAKDQWLLMSNQAETATPVATDIDPYLKGGTANVFCPIDGGQAFATSYSINAGDTVPTCLQDPANHVLT